jgi:hypothetical protein
MSIKKDYRFSILFRCKDCNAFEFTGDDGSGKCIINDRPVSAMEWIEKMPDWCPLPKIEFTEIGN